MTNPYESAVIQNILRHSHSKDYREAIREWSFEGEVIDHGELNNQMGKGAHCQACGHRIRYGYIINNKKNHKKMEIGSECIGNYEGISPGRLDTALKTMKKKQSLATQEHINKTHGNFYWKVVAPIMRAIYAKHEKRANSIGYTVYEQGKTREKYPYINQGSADARHNIKVPLEDELRKVPSIGNNDDYSILRNIKETPVFIQLLRKYKVRADGAAFRKLAELEPIIRARAAKKRR